MWAYLLSKPRTESKSEDVELEQAESEFMLPATNAHPAGVRPLFVHVGKKRVWVLVKADLTDAQAEIISNNDCLLTGTVKLIWWEPIMASDFQRTLIENEQEEPGFKVCKIDLGKVGDKEAAVLAMLVKNLPDGPDKAELLEVLAGKKLATEEKPDALGFMAELETLIPLFKQAAAEGVDDKAALESLIAKAKEMPDGMAKEIALEVLSDLLGAETKRPPEGQPTGTGLPAGLLQNLMKNLRQF